MLLQVLGVLIAGLVLTQAGYGLFAYVRRTRTSQAILDHAVDRARASAEAVRAAKRANQSDLSWVGYRKFAVLRKVLENPAGDICSFYLAPHDGRPLPEFHPGQFLTFELDIRTALRPCARCGETNPPNARFCRQCGTALAEPTSPDGRNSDKPTVRCYSLSDCHDPEHYRVSIKKALPPRNHPDAPPGLASNFFHDRVQQGDILNVMAPSGKFFLDLRHERPAVLIGGGVGVTPVLSMLNAIVKKGSRREAWFFYGVRHGDEHIQREHLQQVARDHPNVHLNVCYSEPDGARSSGVTAEEGRDYHHRERVSVDLLKRLLPSNNYQFYICGPPPMMAAMVEGLSDWGVPDDDIRFEAFGPATVKRSPSATRTLAIQAPGALSVTFAKSNKTCAWSKDDTFLLELAEKNGVAMDSGCRVGNCNTCLTAIKEGQVAYLTEPDTMPEKGSCLTCISIPKTNLVLDA